MTNAMCCGIGPATRIEMNTYVIQDTSVFRIHNQTLRATRGIPRGDEC